MRFHHKEENKLAKSPKIQLNLTLRYLEVIKKAKKNLIKDVHLFI